MCCPLATMEGGLPSIYQNDDQQSYLIETFL
jgi:hypothetical protein